MTLFQAFLVGTWYFILSTPGLTGRSPWFGTFYRPMVTGLVIGCILGDPIKGLQVGSTINLIYIGVIGAGGAVPADAGLAGTLGTALAISGNLDAETAVALAVPIGLLGITVNVTKWTANTIFVPMVDKIVEKGETKHLWVYNVLLPTILLYILQFTPCFLAAYFGIDFVTGIIQTLSGTFLSALRVVGGALPAVGIAILLSTIFQGKARYFFFLGFAGAIYLGLGALPSAIIFGIIAFITVSSDGGFDLSAFKGEGSADDSKRILSRGALRQAYINWCYCLQTCFNYERNQGIGFLHAMRPVLDELYPDETAEKDERIAFMKRHSEFFNSEVGFGASILGLTIAMEEQKKLGADIEPEAFTSIKSGLMGPLAGIGDTVWQGIIMSILLAVFLPLGAEGNLMGPLLYTLIYTGLFWAFSYFMMNFGYTKGSEAILNLIESGVLNKVIEAASILGCAVMGALVKNYVTLKLGIEVAGVNLQEGLFDAIIPCILPLCLTLGVNKIIKKGVNPSMIIIAIVIIGFALGYAGILTT